MDAAMAQTQTLLHHPLGQPVLVAGAKSNVTVPEESYIVVGFRTGASGTPPQLRAYHAGNVSDSAFVEHDLPSDPVALQVTDDDLSQYEFVAVSGATNELLVYRAGAAGAPLQTVTLPGAPIAMTIGLAPGNALPSHGGLPKGTSTGLVHLIVEE